MTAWSISPFTTGHSLYALSAEPRLIGSLLRKPLSPEATMSDTSRSMDDRLLRLLKRVSALEAHGVLSREVGCYWRLTRWGECMASGITLGIVTSGSGSGLKERTTTHGRG